MGATDILNKHQETNLSKKGKLFEFGSEAPVSRVGSYFAIPNKDNFPQVSFGWPTKLNITKFKMRAFRFPTTEELRALGLESNAPDGNYWVNGEHVLMVRSMDAFNKTRKYKAERAARALENIRPAIQEQMGKVTKQGRLDGEIEVATSTVVSPLFEGE